METYRPLWSSFRQPRRLRENHSGMETTIYAQKGVQLLWLRENHSGMETRSVEIPSQLRFLCCVRTIVVWKLNTMFWGFLVLISCVRTIVVWKRIARWAPCVEMSVSCVRTIVVWKLLAASSWIFLRSSLRENHSGMETLFRSALFNSFFAPLRENHSGMETYTVIGFSCGFRLTLRENHSGMETAGFG